MAFVVYSLLKMTVFFRATVFIKVVKRGLSWALFWVSTAGFLNLAASQALAEVVNAIYNSPTDVPITASNYTATGRSVSFTLNFAPSTGTELVVVRNTGPS